MVIKIKTYKFILILLCTVILSGCSLQDITIEKIDSNESAADEEIYTDNKEKIPTGKLGEKINAWTLAKSGTIYLTINNAEYFNSMSEAGINEKNKMPYDVSCGLTESGDVEKGFVIAKLHISVENIDAIGSMKICDPNNEFDDYDFRVDNFLVGPNTETYCEIIYCSKMGECESSIYCYNLKPGESTEYDIAYIAYMDGHPLEDMIAYGGNNLKISPWIKLDIT